MPKPSDEKIQELLSADTAASPNPFIPKGLKKALAPVTHSVDSASLLDALIQHWGGTDQLALDIATEFRKAAVAA
jgi:hypothetical protein